MRISAGQRVVMPPDTWSLISANSEDKHLGCFIYSEYKGGYLYGDSWIHSSSIEEYEVKEDEVLFTTESGSEYTCSPHAFKERASLELPEGYRYITIEELEEIMENK